MGTAETIVAGGSQARGADDAGGAGGAGDARRDAAGRRGARRDGGLLPRRRAQARDRHALRRRALHQPDPRPPRPPRHHGGVLRRQARALPAGREARSSPTPTTPTAAGSPPRSRASRPSAGRKTRTTGSRAWRRRGGTRFFLRHAGGVLELQSPLLGPYNVLNVAGAAALALARAWSPRSVERAVRDMGQVPGRFERVVAARDSASRWSWTTPTRTSGSRPCCGSPGASRTGGA